MRCYLKSILAFLVFVLVLSIIPSFGQEEDKDEQEHHDNDNDSNIDNHNVFVPVDDNEELQVDETLLTSQESLSEPPSPEHPKRAPWIFSERGVLALNPNILTLRSDEFTSLILDHQSLEFSTSSTHSSLLLLLVHDPDCPASQTMLHQFEAAAQLLKEFVQSSAANEYYNPPLFGKLMGPAVPRDLLAELGITAVPKLLFGTTTTTTNSNSNNTVEDCVWLDYTGRQSTPQDIFQTALHYYLRLVLACGEVQLGEQGHTPIVNYDNDDDDDDDDNDDPVTTTENEGKKADASSAPTPQLLVSPPHFSTLAQAQDTVTMYRHALFQYAATYTVTTNHDQDNNTHSNPRSTLWQPALPPEDYTEAEKRYIRWLLYDEYETNNHDRDEALVEDYVFVVHCRRPSPHGTYSSQSRALHQTFLQMSRAMSNRRDRWFVTVDDCEDVFHDRIVPDEQDNEARDNVVLAYKIPVGPDVDWARVIRTTLKFPSENEPVEESIIQKRKKEVVEFLVKTCTPSIMWFDRQVTAPIAFPLFRKVHAVLFVDLHHSGLLENYHLDNNHLFSRQTVRHFRTACRNHWRFCRDNVKDDMVCLVVPSTETRLLTTLGIDIWSPLDEHLVAELHRGARRDDTDETESVDLNVLPTLLVTDQRFRGTRRYYLERNEMLAFQQNEIHNNPISQFIDHFWLGELEYDLKSDPRGPRTNAAGIRILTANSLDELVTPRVSVHDEGDTHDSTNDSSGPNGGHAIVAFVVPSCGHCKRFMTLYNDLAVLLNHIGWSKNLVTLYYIDITKNDIMDLDVKVQWVPDLYYLPPDKSVFVAYNRTDNRLGDTVGAMSDSMEILDWFLGVAFATSESDQQVRELLVDLENLG